MNISTTVTIPELGQTTLLFGARFRVRYGRDDIVLRDALLNARAANGDLIFLVDPDASGANGGARRVRPSTITFLAGSGVDAADLTRDDDESAAAFLARAERLLGAGYTEWIGADAGQGALAAVAAEDRANGKARRSKPSLAPLGRAYGEVKAGRKAGRKAAIPRVSVPSDAELDAALAAAVRDADALASELGYDPDRVAAAVVELHPELAAKPKKAAKPYADRNQVWKCGSCKRRTRAPICGNGHPPVSAPAGKRRDDRTAK